MSSNNPILVFTKGLLPFAFFFLSGYAMWDAEPPSDISNDIHIFERYIDSLNSLKGRQGGGNHVIYKENWELSYFKYVETILQNRISAPFIFKDRKSYFDDDQRNQLFHVDPSSSLELQLEALVKTFQIVNRIDTFSRSYLNDSLFAVITKALKTSPRGGVVYLNLYQTSNPATAKIDVLLETSRLDSIVVSCHVMTDTLFAVTELDFKRICPLLHLHWSKIFKLTKQEAIDWGQNLPFLSLPYDIQSLIGVPIKRKHIPPLIVVICTLALFMFSFKGVIETKMLPIQILITIMILPTPYFCFFLPLYKFLHIDIFLAVVLTLSIPCVFVFFSIKHIWQIQSLRRLLKTTSPTRK